MGMSEWLIGGGLGVGIIFGVLVQRFRFCMVAGISNWLLVNDKRQLMAFAAMLLVAIGGVQLLEISNTVAIGTSSYRNSQFDWLGVILGGVLFGIGASLAGGCAARTIVKTAEGSMQSLLALMSFLVFAAITQFMYLEGPRLALTAATAITLEGDAGLASILGISAWIPMLLVVLGLGFVIYRNKDTGLSRNLLIAGAVIGGLVVISWYITGVLAQDEFDPRKPSAITISGPMARIGFLVLSGSVPAFSFAVSFVVGLFAASLLSALFNKEFKLTPIASGMWLYAIIGGALMGIGGILAYGCNVGQGLTGISTLSIESIFAVISMVVGTWLGLKWWGSRG